MNNLTAFLREQTVLNANKCVRAPMPPFDVSALPCSIPERKAIGLKQIFETMPLFLGAGVYGTLENKVAIASEQSEGRFRYLLKRVFMPYSSLVINYPNLKKHPILYPFYTVKRWCRIVFGKGRERAMSEIKYNATVSDNRKQRLSSMCAELNLIGE